MGRYIDITCPSCGDIILYDIDTNDLYTDEEWEERKRKEYERPGQFILSCRNCDTEFAVHVQVALNIKTVKVEV